MPLPVNKLTQFSCDTVSILFCLRNLQRPLRFIPSIPDFTPDFTSNRFNRIDKPFKRFDQKRFHPFDTFPIKRSAAPGTAHVKRVINMRHFARTPALFARLCHYLFVCHFFTGFFLNAATSVTLGLNRT